MESCSPLAFGQWSELYFFARYLNVPAFSVVPGDILAFDLAGVNDYRPAFASIAFGTDPDPVYTSVVYDSEASSKGDTIIGNFEVQFTISAPYTFAGGALHIRFMQNGYAASHPGGFAFDMSCNMVVVSGRATDTSG
jgi:hypothetical protein